MRSVSDWNPRPWYFPLTPSPSLPSLSPEGERVAGEAVLPAGRVRGRERLPEHFLSSSLATRLATSLVEWHSFGCSWARAGGRCLGFEASGGERK